MRKNGSGIIVNVSSVAGRIGFPGTPAYISSKFALEGLSECMRYELSPFGIKTIIIEPGVIQDKLFLMPCKLPKENQIPLTRKLLTR